MPSETNRVYNKINYETSFTDLSVFLAFAKFVKEKGEIEKRESSRLFGQKRAEIGTWNSPNDTHARPSLYQYCLIEDIDDDKFKISRLGERFINVFDENGDFKSLDEAVNVIFDMLISWHDVKEEKNIHPGVLILKLMIDPDLGGYFTDQDFAHICNDTDNKNDSQYDEIKGKILAFRTSGRIYTRNEMKKAYTPLTGYKNWGVFKYYESDSNNPAIKYFELTPKYKDKALEYFNLSENVDEDWETPFYEEVKMEYRQEVHYGAPGTGKSYDIDKDLDDQRVTEEQIVRVIFHPDYTYGDFIGMVRPVRDDKGINYTFVPGPLTTLLKKCFLNPNKKYYLLIEEINRGSAAGIFGDLFQLLDRDDNGKSKYKIENQEISLYLTKSLKLVSIFILGRIWFPSNLNIICTMNTADQNVFVLDSALKRRFEMKYVPIDFSKLQGTDLDEMTDVFSGGTELINVFQNTELSTYATKLKNEGKLNRNWETFALLTNKLIDIININEGGEQVSEDKKLGPFFVSKQDIRSKEKFVNKVIYYLKQDVFKYIEVYLVDSYQIIYDKYSKTGDIFELLKPGVKI